MCPSRLGLLMPGILLACQRTAPPHSATVRQRIEANNANATRWYLAGHADSLVSLYAQDVWQLPPNMPPVVGRDSLRVFWTQAFKWGSWDFDRRTQEVVTSGSIAAERGRYTLKFTPGAQAPIPAIEDRGNYVVFWREDPDGQWRVVWDAPVSEVPPSGRSGH
jgi:ketosteroid isomerase-like protein